MYYTMVNGFGVCLFVTNDHGDLSLAVYHQYTKCSLEVFQMFSWQELHTTIYSTNLSWWLWCTGPTSKSLDLVSSSGPWLQLPATSQRQQWYSWVPTTHGGCMHWVPGSQAFEEWTSRWELCLLSFWEDTTPAHEAVTLVWVWVNKLGK